MAKVVNDMTTYIIDLLKNGAQPHWYKKYARVSAEIGVPGQEIVTILANGTKEIAGVVKVDEKGNPDWIITNPGGEKYACPHAKFVKKYDLQAGKGADGKYAPKGAAIEAIEVNEDITFMVPWGENGAPIPFNLQAGGYLNITDLHDVYGIGKDEFKDTYALCDQNGIFEDKDLRQAFGQEAEDEMENQ